MNQIGEDADGVARNLQEYADAKRQAQEERMNVAPDERSIKEFEARLQSTVENLRQHVAEQKEALKNLRRQTGSKFTAVPSSDPRTRLQQLRTISRAYDNLSESVPTLPSTESVIPSILAAHTINCTITETTRKIEDGTSARDQALTDSAALDAQTSDSAILRQHLEQRISNLRTQGEERTVISPEEQLRQVLAEKQRRRRTQQLGLKETQDALAEFIDNYLAPMLAAEELGGPVAGDSEPKKPTQNAEERSTKDPKRQRRIDEIWGSSANRTSTVADHTATMNPEDSAAAEELTSLLNELLKAQKSGGEVFVRLERDSAAARFLVRAKVATFHPRDARRLKIVDFARGWND